MSLSSYFFTDLMSSNRLQERKGSTHKNRVRNRGTTTTKNKVTHKRHNINPANDTLSPMERNVKGYAN